VTHDDRHDGGMEACPYPAVTAVTHSSTKRVLGTVGHPNAEAHLSPVETSTAIFTVGKDTTEDTS